MKLQDILDQYTKAVVIVHYRPDADYNGGTSPQNPACLLQIAVRQDKLSPSKNLIRFGDTQGDEITGWTKIECLEVIEVLGELSDDFSTVTPIERSVHALPATAA